MTVFLPYLTFTCTLPYLISFYFTLPLSHLASSKVPYLYLAFTLPYLTLPLPSPCLYVILPYPTFILPLP
jgi:hypothetical protein